MAGIPGQQTTKSTEVADKYNGDFLESLDGRYRTARTLRQRLRELTNDLGGLEVLSYQERSLCRRVIHLERHIEKKELSLAHGGNITESDYLNAINTLSGLFSKIGMKRRPRPVQSLDDYVKANYSRTETTPDQEAGAQAATSDVSSEDASA